jgi:peptide/nickel transport system permease protein
VIRPVLLWTDMLVFLLVAVVAAFAVHARTREHLRVPWRRVLGSRLGVASMVVLSVYLVIGILDSLHYRAPLATKGEGGEVHYSAEVLSALDALLEPLRTRVEMTYSAPFATHLFTRETVLRDDGTQERVYPRLLYGGAHLGDPARERLPDILNRLATAALEAVLTSVLLLAGLILFLARRHRRSARETARAIVTGRTEIPWRVIWLTSTVIVLLALMAANTASAYHIFGTDKVGQDVFYQSLKSIRTGLLIGTLTTLVMLPFAILLGITAGYARGWLDDFIQYLYTTLNSIPAVLLIAAAILMLQVYIAQHPGQFDTMAARADLRLLFLCIILGITSWTGLCRMLRGETLKLRETDYIQAATAFGVSHGVIMVRHILPNVMHIVLISVVLDFSGLVLAEAVLSYVGVGVDPTMNSWGNMINRARLELAREPMVWWSLLSAFVFMFTLVLAANLFSDAVRDAFDPRLRER